MTQLYPIGTQLITWRLSQAALYYEVFDAKNMESFSAYEGKWIKGFKTHIPQSERSKRGDEDFVSKWRVTVTKKNQNWLSPMPMMVGYYIKQMYPDGQCAPMIEWDKVILPAEGTQS